MSSTRARLGLYVHIPYCAARCSYCDFYTAAGTQVPQAYIQALLRELEVFCAQLNRRPLRPDTFYFGGGTPSLLTPQQVAQLIDAAAPPTGAEITLECNPEHSTLQRLREFGRAGVNRISFGVQTAWDSSLQRLGRRHTMQQARSALAAAQQAGFVQICGDAMLALPNYTPRELTDTLRLLHEGGCTHISAYLLKIEQETVFGRRPPAGLPDDDAAADFYLQAVDELAQMGYEQYEISNFCKPNCQGRHNLLYWQCEDYVGLGPSAAGCLGGQRFVTSRGLARFLREGAAYEQQGCCNAQDYIMLQLRLREGLSWVELARRYGVQQTAHQRAVCEQLRVHGLAEPETGDGVLRLTAKGLLVQNSIICALLE